MVLKELLKKSKNLVVVPLLGWALMCSPVYNKDYDINLDEEQASVSPINTVEECSLNYKVGVYILGIKLFSCNADFYLKKIEENGLVKEVMGAYGTYSDKYYGNFFTVFSKDEDPFEKHSYFISYNQTVFKDEVTFYRDKISFVENDLEKIVDNDGCVGLQSVIKPVLTEDLNQGQVFNPKTFVEGDFYECSLIVKERETIKIKEEYIDAYHVVLETGKNGLRKSKAADLWVVKNKPYNKIVKASFSPFMLTEIIVSSNS